MHWSRLHTTDSPFIAAGWSITAIEAASTSRSRLYTAEVIHRRGPWRSFEAVEFATLEWVDLFNNRPLMEPIGKIPPPEADERYYAMLDEHKLAA